MAANFAIFGYFLAPKCQIVIFVTSINPTSRCLISTRFFANYTEFYRSDDGGNLFMSGDALARTVLQKLGYARKSKHGKDM